MLVQEEVRLVRTSVRTHVTYVDVEINYPDEPPALNINRKPRVPDKKWRKVIQLLRGVRSKG
jgi:hypothetical protein